MKKIFCFFLMLAMIGCNSEKLEDKSTAEKKTEATAVVNTEEKNISKNIKEFDVVKIEADSEGSPRIEIEFSKDLEKNDNLDAYVKIFPETAYKVLKDKNKLVINGDFTAGKSYKVEILKELKSEDGESLKENIIKDVAFNEIEPKIVFSNDGIILPASSGKKIAFKSVNVKKINLKVKKVYENNITQFLHEFQFKGNGNVLDYSVDNEFYKFGDVIFEKNYDINCEKNIWIQTEVELDGLIDCKGLFVVEISFDKEGIDYKFPEGTESWKISSYMRENGRIGKAVLLSDMGITAQEDSDKIIVSVMDITENEPVKKAEVKLISLSSQVIQKGITDDKGEFVFDKAENKFYILSEKDGEKSILKFQDSRLSYDGFAVDGVYSSEGIRAFIYTDRGIYRPGDDVHISFIARNGKAPLPENHPVKMNVYSPTGKKFVDGAVIKDGAEGFYTYSFKTDSDSETGIWRAEAEIGGEKFIKDISVEAVVPYKIKVETEFPKEVALNESREFIGGIKADYLFGAAGSGLKYNSQLAVREEEISFEKYKNYVFKNPTTYDFYYNDYKEGVLDENGKGKVIFNISQIAPKNINLSGIITTRVFESSGRPVISREEVKFNKFESYVGIEIPKDTYIKSGDKINLQVVAVSKDGDKLVSGRNLVYRVYKNEYSWWWDYNDYNSFMKSIKTNRNTVFLYEKEFTSKDEPYLIDYQINGSGEIFVEVEDLETHQSTGINLYSATWQNSVVNKKIDRLKIETDKNSYKAGEKAVVAFEGTKGAKALVTIEKSGKIIDRFWKDAESIKNEVVIDVKKEMFPNAYVAVALFQNYNDVSNDRPVRLYGTVPIIVEDEETKLDIKIEAPKEIKPNEKFTVKIRNNENRKMRYTVAVVDEGLLNITGFSTPDPWNYFYQKEALQIGIFDNYSEIMGKSFGKVHQVLKTGGDGFVNEMAVMKSTARAKQLGIEEAQRFKPVAMFKGICETDEKGEGTVEFEMPNYMGAVKIMVVGVDGEKYGSSEAEIIVKAPVVADVSLPRTLKIGDEFKVPVSVFALEDDIGNVKVKIDFNGSSQVQEISFDEKGSKTLYFTEKAGGDIGRKEIKISAVSDAYTFEETTEIDVNSNNPYIYINELKTLKSGEEAVYKQPVDYIKGSGKGVITISTSPILAVEHRVNELVRYPYGCVEQTVSAVFPQLYINILADENKFDSREAVGNINAGIAKLAGVQLYDGSFPYWAGRDGELWITNYVAYFLTEAKSMGYFVPEDMYSRAVSYMKKSVKSSSDEISLNEKIYSLYVLALAENPEISEMNLIYENYFDELDLVSKWRLLASYKLIGDGRTAEDIAGKLPVEILKEDKKSDEKNKNYYGSEIQDEAVILNCYYTVYGKIEEKLYSEILSKLQSNEWLSTQSMSLSLTSIGGIKRETADGEIRGTVFLDEKEEKFETKNGIFICSIPDGVENIKITTEGGKEAFSNYYWEGVPLNYKGEDVSKNLKLERYYYNDKGEKINPESMQSGASFWLEIKVLPSNKDSGYFYVNDMALVQVLPTGWEIENMRAVGGDYPQWVQEKINSTVVEYQDIRDDRVMWFFDFDNYNPNGKNFFVKINAVTAGKFDFPGTTAEGMYNNNYQAYLKGFKAEVK